jgi:hypothetical protein
MFLYCIVSAFLISGISCWFLIFRFLRLITNTKGNIYRTVLIKKNTHTHTHKHTHTHIHTHAHTYTLAFLISKIIPIQSSYVIFVPVWSVICKQAVRTQEEVSYRNGSGGKKKVPPSVTVKRFSLLKQTLVTKNKVTHRRINTRYTWRYVKSRPFRYGCSTDRCMLCVRQSWFVLLCVPFIPC